MRASIGLTLRVAALSTVLAAMLGMSAALLVRSLGRTRTPFLGRLFTRLLQVTLPLPHVVAATAMVLLLGQSGTVSRIGYALGLVEVPADFPALTQDAFGWGIVASYVWKEAPFVAVVVLAVLSRQVADAEDAARVLGAGRWQRVRHVLVPAVGPAVGSASVLVFAFTLGSYEVPFLLGRPFPATLPVLAYEGFRDPDLAARPAAAAAAVLITVLVGVCVLAYLSLAQRVRR